MDDQSEQSLPIMREKGYEKKIQFISTGSSTYGGPDRMQRNSKGSKGEYH